MKTLLAIAIGVAASAAHAQSFPTKPVRIVIGVAAGGLSDTLARGVAAELTKTWGQSVLVENRPGAGDIVAAELVAKAAPDGHTLYQTNANLLMVNEFLRKDLPFNAAKDFTPVIGLVRTSDVLIARPTLGVNTVAELVALARAKPGALNYGSFGVGSAAHFDAEKFAAAAQIKFVHIPYKGGALVMQALLANSVDFAFTGLTAALPLIRSGKLKALAWGAEERAKAIPDVPTLREQGYDFETGSWLGFLAPSATPAAIVEKISADTYRALAVPAFREKFVLGVGLEPMDMPVAKFRGFLEDTRSRYATLFKTVTIKLD